MTEKRRFCNSRQVLGTCRSPRQRAKPRDPLACARGRPRANLSRVRASARAKLDSTFLHQHQLLGIRSYFLESDFFAKGCLGILDLC